MRFGITKRDTSLRNDIDDFRKSIASLFDDFFNIKPSGFFENEWHPIVDVNEDSKTISVKAEIPGVDEKDINVTLEDNLLTISGEKKTEHTEENKDKRYLVSERSYGSFSRTLQLPDNIKGSDIKAEFKKGVLTVNIPKQKVEEPKRIKIDVN